jgi:hypothetical protein
MSKIVSIFCFLLILSGIALAGSLSGTYYIGAAGTAPGGTDPKFLSLKSACDSINADTIKGDCIFYFTSNLTETANVALGKDPTPFTITFKPYAGVSPTLSFSQSTDNSGPSGAWVFGSNNLTSWDYLVATRNIIVDGSNTDGGTTRDLTITTAATAHANANPIRMAGNVNKTTVKNVVIYTQQSVTYGFLLTHRYTSTNTTFYTPDSITVENCSITNTISASGQALAVSNSGTFPSGTLPSMTGIVFKNNVLTAKTRGIFLNYAGSTDIIGNHVIVNQTGSGYMSFGILGNLITNTTDVQNIFDNQFTLLASANSAVADYGIVGIQGASRGAYNIVNNFITGFEATTVTANPSCRIIGIRMQTADVITNVLHNTIQMNNLAITPGTGTVLYAGIYVKNGINTVKNNIVINAEGDFKSHCIYREATSGTLSSDYNDFYRSDTLNAKTGFWSTADVNTLADWVTASALDSHSVAKATELVSATDLHLAGASVGDFNLAGVPLAEVSTDIDGETRSTLYPYMGADEGSVELAPPAPVIWTMAEARIDSNADFIPDLKGDTVTVRGVITTPNYSTKMQYYFEDATAGLQLYSGSLTLSFNAGDEVEVTGKIDQYRGSTEIVPLSADDITVISTGNTLAPEIITIADIGEATEGLLVRVDNVWLVDPSLWPTAGNGATLKLTDGVDTTNLYIDKDTELDGWAPPPAMMSIIAPVDQYTSGSSVYDDGYQLRGTFQSDFIEIKPEYIPISEARADTNADFIPDMKGDTVTVRGVITTPNYYSKTQYYFEDATAGIMLYSGALTLAFNTGDQIEVKGKIDHYRGATEIVPLSADVVTLLSTGNIVEPKKIEVADVGEAIEGQLVRVDSVWLVDPSQWPTEGNGATLKFTDGVDTANIYIDKDTELDGWAPPQMMSIIAPGDQYSSGAAIYNDGYQLRGTFKKDFIEISVEVVEITPDSLDFGAIAVNSSKSMEVLFKNIGTNDIVIDSVKFSDSHFTTTLTVDTTVVPDSTIATPVTFKPTAPEEVTAIMTYFTSAGNYTVKVMGSAYQVLTALTEGFESVETGKLPDGWLAFADSIALGLPDPAWRVTDATEHTGDKAAYMPNYNTKSNCWLVTPALALGIDKHYLTLYVKDDLNSSGDDFHSQMDVFVSTKSQNNVSDFTRVATWKENEFYDKWGYKAIDLAGIQGEHVYVGFMVHNFGDPNNPNAGGDNWCIDDVLLSDSVTAITDLDNGLPKEYALSQNYPNPFNPTTHFEVALPKAGEVTIVLYNMIGQEVLKVFDGNKPAGFHKFEVNAAHLASGMYYYRVTADKFSSVKKMILMK